MIIGSGFWWSSALVGQIYYNYLLDYSANLFFEYVLYLVWALLTIGFTVVSRLFAKPEQRKLVAIIVITICVLLLITELSVRSSHLVVKSGQFSVAIRFFFIVSYTILMFLWAARFALLEAKDAGFTVVHALGVSLVLTILIGMIPYEYISAMRIVFNAISAVLFILDNNKSTSVQRSEHFFDPKNRPKLNLFFLSRIAVGFIIGVSNSLLILLSHEPEYGTLRNVTLCVAALLLVGFMVFSVKRSLNPIFLLPLTPLISLIVLSLIFFYDQFMSFSYIAPAGMCLVWIVLSSVRISELKHIFARSEVQLACIDKALVVGSIAAGILVYPLVSSLLPSHENNLYAMALLMFAVAIGVTGVLLQFSFRQLISTYTCEQTANERNYYVAACKSIADSHKLTERELDILLLIGQGYSRPYVCKTLYISDGTVRTHIRHIYSKLMVHRKEEMLELIKAKIDASSEETLPPVKPAVTR